MSTVGGGVNIVTDGLVLYLDAANTKSYISGSTIWNDVSRSQTNGTLINGPTFSSGNGGSIVFDGVNDYTDCGSSSTINIGTSSFSVEVAVKFTGTGVYQVATRRSTNDGANGNRVFDGFNIFCDTGRIGAGFRHTATVNTDYAAQSTTTLNSGNWVIVTAVFSRASNLVLYVNGFTNATTSISALNGVNINLTQNFQIGRRLIAGGTNDLYFLGSIGIFRYYNKALSAQEVLQNYNATRTRYGL